MEIAVKATYAHLVKDESLVQNSDKLYIVEFCTRLSSLTRWA